MTTQLDPSPQHRVECRDCLHFSAYPYGPGTTWKRKTGCYHPELIVQKQSEDFLREQRVAGDHEQLNLRGDCTRFEARPRRGSLLQRVLAVMLS